MEIMLSVNHLHKEKKLSKEKIKEDIKKPYLHLKANLEGRHLQDGHHKKGMKKFFIVTVIHAINMVTKVWIANIMKGRIMEGFITP
jgi:sarcosine oxidase delta subunit